MRTRNHEWLDLNTMHVKYGIQVFVDGRWQHARKGRAPLIFGNAEARGEVRKELRKLKVMPSAS